MRGVIDALIYGLALFVLVGGLGTIVVAVIAAVFRP